MKEEFIKNVLDTIVDHSRGTIRYKISAMYNIEQVDEEDEDFTYYDIEHKTIEDFTMTFDEIKKEGGVSEINKQLKECYNV